MGAGSGKQGAGSEKRIDRLCAVSREFASFLGIIAILLIAPFVFGSPQTEATSSARDPRIVEGDSHHDRRDEGHAGDRADPREILAAISSYEAAAQSPESAEARWKLARALYFRGADTGLDAEGRRAVFEKARRVSDEAIRILGRRTGARDLAGE